MWYSIVHDNEAIFNYLDILRNMFQKSDKGYNITIKTILNEYI